MPLSLEIAGLCENVCSKIRIFVAMDRVRVI